MGPQAGRPDNGPVWIEVGTELGGGGQHHFFAWVGLPAGLSQTVPVGDGEVGQGREERNQVLSG